MKLYLRLKTIRIQLDERTVANIGSSKFVKNKANQLFFIVFVLLRKQIE